MFFYVAIDVAHTLFLQYFINSDENTSLLHVTETVIDSRTEELHRGTEAHVSIYQRGNIVAQLTDFAIQYTVIILERITTENTGQFLFRRLNHKRFNVHNQIYLVIKVHFGKIKNHVTDSKNVRRIHRHLSKEILTIGINNHQSSQSIP